MDTKRIFIAIDISDEARWAISEYIFALKSRFHDGVRWEHVEKLHLTVKFIGKTDGETVNKLTAGLSKIALNHSAFDLTLNGTGAFPSAKNARVLWIGIVQSSMLQKLYTAVEDACFAAGFPRESRAFSPHLTIARIKDVHRANELTREHLSLAFGPISFRVPRIVIYESKLLPSGSVYSVLSTHQLKTDSL